jgi:hypothetical protein
MLRCLLLLLVVGVSGLPTRAAAVPGPRAKSPLHVGVAACGVGVAVAGVAACGVGEAAAGVGVAAAGVGVALAGVGVAEEGLQGGGPAEATSGKYGTGSDGEFVFSLCSCGLILMFFSLFSSGATSSWTS